MSGALLKHLYPEPRIALGMQLAKAGLVTAMMDLSDGLSTDLGRLCASSRVGARVDSRRLPLPRFSRRSTVSQAEKLALALHGGDDYELLFTVSPSRARRLPKVLAGTPLTAIGEVTRERRVCLLDANGKPRQLLPGGWDPFRAASKSATLA